ncbi:PucR family transcriptional regulator [Kordiimonas marina]|uniref:PucR family transcriptional regulator n=1 Tax=Kordiimonas marina TaxID=2872312 RepID=UPI001FF53397|nr:helix-turn-helix domain-containing protein [Kordiimonas marina]MCJ9430528.1 helix-turn-helix domain-containing protein [Kordiimonas marina]
MTQISPRIRELLRAGAERSLQSSQEWLSAIDIATMEAIGGMGDPVAMARMRRANRLNVIHWATATIRAPGEPMAPNLTSEILQTARDQVRQGSPEALQKAFRAGQNVGWTQWMEIAFELTDDPAELKELLDVSARSIAQFIEVTVDALLKQMERERAELSRGSPTERRELVSAILNRQPMDLQATSRKLGYRLDQAHQAVIIWSEDPEPDAAALDGMAETLKARMGDLPTLTIVENRAALWLWLPRALAAEDVEPLCPPSLRIALGPRAEGVGGFGRSHQGARLAQRILSGAAHERRVASYAMVKLVSVLTQDKNSLQAFTADTLGKLAEAPVALRESLLTFLSLGCNSSHTAEKLGIHRNTLLRHIARAEDLLPRPLDDSSRLTVAVALEALRWQV